MRFEKGKPKTGGRRPGVGNKFTGIFRDAIRHVYTGLGGHANFLVWARANETEFYRIAARLIPGEMQEGNGAGNIVVIVNRAAAFGNAGPVLDVPSPAPKEERDPLLLDK